MDVIVLGRVMPDSGKLHQNQEVYDTKGGGSCTLKAAHYKDPPKILEENMDNKQYRIRRLTPKECYRLMGFNDEQFDKAKQAGISDTQLYKQAGNSIVVDVLEQIMGNLYDAMPYLFDDLKVSSYFSGIGAFESALDRVYKNKRGETANV